MVEWEVVCMNYEQRGKTPGVRGTSPIQVVGLVQPDCQTDQFINPIT